MALSCARVDARGTGGPRSDIYALGCVIVRDADRAPRSLASAAAGHAAAQRRPSLAPTARPDVPPASTAVDAHARRSGARIGPRRRGWWRRRLAPLYDSAPQRRRSRPPDGALAQRAHGALAQPTRRLARRRRLTLGRTVVVAAALIAIFSAECPCCWTPWRRTTSAAGQANRHDRYPCGSSEVDHGLRAVDDSRDGYGHLYSPAPQSTAAPGPQTGYGRDSEIAGKGAGRQGGCEVP